MPSLGNHVDAVFIPESVNTSTTLRINGGDLHLDDGKKALFGQSDDLQIYHDGSNSYINDAGVGGLRILSNRTLIKNAANSVTLADFTTADNSVILYKAGSARLQTTTDGVTVTGTALATALSTGASGTGINISTNTISGPATLTIDPAAIGDDTGTVEIKGNLTVQGTTTTINSTTVDLDHLSLGDNEVANFGEGNDLQIYHESTFNNSVIKETGGGNLLLGGGNIDFRDAGLGETYALFKDTGTNTSVELYYDDSKKLETTSTGVTVTGTTATTGLTVTNDASVNGINFGHGNNNVGGNILIGDGLSSITSGNNNIAIGSDRALEFNTTGGGNIAIGGDRPLWNNTTGGGNIAIGSSRQLGYNTTGSGNIAIGDDRTLHLNTTGSSNIALGRDRVLENNDSGGGNIAIGGYFTLHDNTSGNDNVAIGSEALKSNTTADHNIALGNKSLYSNSTGEKNVVIGFEAGYYIGGSNNTIIGGYKGGALDASLSNTVIISAGTTEKLRIASDGNVGIGTNNPTEKLEVDGVILSSGPIVDTVWYKETWPAYNETTATLAGNDLGTWTLTGGTLLTGTPADHFEVDLARLPSGLKAVRWAGASAVSYFTSPTVDLSDFRTNQKITTVNQTGSLADRSVSDSRIYLTVLLAAQSLDTSAEHMEVQLSNDDGVTFHEHQAFVWQDSHPDSINDTSDTTWRKVVVDISEFVYEPSTSSDAGFKIRFKGTGTGSGDSYGVSNIYIHDAPIPNKLKAKTLKLGDATLTESNDLDYDEYLEIVSSNATFKGLVLNESGSVRDNYVGLSSPDSLVLAADELNAGDNSRIDFRIDAKNRMKLYTSTNAGASEAHLQLIGHTTPTNRSNWRITAEDNGTNGKFSISDYSGGSWTPNLTVLEGGNVGIGTDDPSSPLDVIGNFEFRSPDANDTTNTKIVGQFDGAGTRNTYLRIGANENRRASIVFSGVNTSTDASTDYWSIGRGDSDELNASSFFIATGESGGNTAKLVIDSNGNVGIGTDSPSAQLEVINGDTSSRPYLILGDGTNNRFIIDRFGQIGIDVPLASIDARLHISTANYTGIYVEDVVGNGVFTADDGNGDVIVNNKLYVGGTTNYLSSQPTGTYGSIQINGGGKGGWKGYSIDGRAVFMHDGSATHGLYDDVNNHWSIRHIAGATSTTQIRSGNNVNTIVCTGTNQVGMGIDTPTRGPLHIHQGTTGDTQIHMTNSETGTASTDGFTIFTGGSTGGHSGFVNREASARIRFLMHPSGGSSVTDQMVLLADGNLGLGISDPTQKLHMVGGKMLLTGAVLSGTNHSAIRSEATIDSVNRDTVFNLRLQTTMDNSGTTSGDREQGGIYNLITNNATGGDTGNEQRVYGVWNDINNYGDPDQLYGTWNNIDTYHTSGTITSLNGAYSLVQVRAAGNITNLYANYSLAQPTTGSTGTVGTLVGVRARTNLAGTSSVSLTNQWGVWGNIDNDANVVASGIVSCFYGSYDTTGDITRPYGIYMGTSNLSHYLSGALGVGNADNPKSYTNFGALHIGDETTAQTSNDIVFGKRVTTAQTNLPRIGQCDILGTASNNDLGLCATSSGGAIGFFTGNNAIGYGASGNELRMTIEAAGNIGIGTNNPSQKLDVYTGTYNRVYVGNYGDTVDGDRHRFGVYRQDTIGGTVNNGAPMFHVNHNGAVYAHSSVSAGRTRTDANTPTNIYAHGAHALDVFSGRTDSATAYRTRAFIKAWDGGDVADRNFLYFVDSQSDTVTADYDQHQRFGIKADGMTHAREDIWSGRVESDEATPNSVYTASNTNTIRCYATNSNAQIYMQAVAVPTTSIYSLYVETGTSSADDDVQFRVRSTDGAITSDAGSIGTPGDYAECFEWEDGNPDNEDRVGISVVLVGEQIKPATSSDDPSKIIGIVSANPIVVGDAAPLKHRSKYLKDDWGRDIMEDVEMLVWNIGQNEYQPKQSDTFALEKADECIPVSDIDEALAAGRLKQWVVDQNLRRMDRRRKLNPDYDVSKKDSYKPRLERQEWDAIGIVGKLFMRKGQPTGTNWIKLSDKTESIERWLVR